MKFTLTKLLLWIFFGFIGLAGCGSKETLFQEVASSHSGIRFNNRIVENDTMNPIDVTNIYNGGGVGIGDFNNDGLQDIYFTGNLVSNKLYINKGDLEFEDVTQKAAVSGEGRWSRGVAVVDINNDGWQDLYVCTSMLPSPSKRTNLLYINQGADASGTPTFKEEAGKYGLADTSHSTMAAFFDYDNDSDLDMYLVVNEILKDDIPSVFRPKINDGSHPSTGRLYRNNGTGYAGGTQFTNVTAEAGLTLEGYGHGVNIADINKDGWKDIFVTNDFNSNDLLYINNGNGTFTDKAATYFKHTSANGMGQDIIDINNDGLSDVIELDMNPEDNYRKKMMMGPNSYQMYQNSDHYGYQYQYVRNTLQLNGGPRVGENDSIGDPVFSDVGYFAGVAETDWSWTPLVTDFDNDGLRDIYITNGFPKDVTDHDFIAFRRGSYSVASKEYTLAQIPEVKLHNYAFRNTGDVRFQDHTEDWGLTKPTFSNGAAYADLDNDGDMDMVINNINDEALLYRNNSVQGKDLHSLTVKLSGSGGNRNGIGAWVEVYHNNTKQVYEQTPYRGYLSTVQLNPHFGLGKSSRVDSVVVRWPSGKLQMVVDVPVDRTLEFKEAAANLTYTWSDGGRAERTLLTDITSTSGLDLVHEQTDFIDFNIQKLLPHKFSEYGPAMAVGDIDGNGLEDLVTGGTASHPGILALQQAGGGFTKRPWSAVAPAEERWVHMGLSLFDADGDGDLDLYEARGGYESAPGSADYIDRLLINDGKGTFVAAAQALPANTGSTSCVRAADWDRDGDLDLFVGGRVEPWNYPKPVGSYILRNDTKGGMVRFTDVSKTAAPALAAAGLVCDAVWTDFDGDGWQDMVLAGEWMPLRFLKNDKGSFRDITDATGTGGQKGWWTSIVPGDFDNDGDMDYIAGNLGLNSFFKASPEQPVRIYAKDFDGNGSYDAVPSLYLKAAHGKSEYIEAPAHTRDDMTKQLISFKSKFQNYKSYALAPFSQMFGPQELKDALVLEATYLANSFVRNLGGGKFEVLPLPSAAQYACLNGMLAEDFDGDGNLDLLATGNDYGTEPTVGRYDACNGLLLRGDGAGKFSVLSILESGWFVPGNGKSLVKLRNAAGGTTIAAAQNRGPVKMYTHKKEGRTLPLLPGEHTATILFKNGRQQKVETGYGASFLSQSGRFLNISSGVSSVELVSGNGSKRVVAF